MKRKLQKQSYLHVLKTMKTSGGLHATLQGAPTCRVVREHGNHGITKNYFRHMYAIGDKATVCDCEAMDTERNLALGSHAPETLSFTNTCVHIDALNMLGPDCETVREYGPIAILGPTALSFAPSETPFSRVSIEIDIKHHRYVCLTCKERRMKTCEHVASLMDHLTDNSLHGTHPFLSLVEPQETLETPPAMPKGQTKAPPPHRPIPLDHLSEPVRLRHTLPLKECVPSAHGHCSCGQAWSEAALSVIEPRATLYGSYESAHVVVYERTCVCGQKKSFDGLEDGIFVYSPQTLWLQETLLAYVDLMIEARMPFNAYYKVLERQYERRGTSRPCCRSTFISSIEAFLHNLDIDYDHSFSCPICSALPAEDQVFIIDGKCMGFRRDLMESFDPPTDKQRSEVIPGTHYAYIGGDGQAQKLASMLRNYSKGTKVTDTEFSSMLRLSKSKASELAIFLQSLKPDHLTCPERYRQLIYDVASPCPMSCLVPKVLYRAEHLINKDTFTQDDQKELLAWGSLSRALSGMSCVPKPLRPLLIAILKKAQIPGNFVGDAQGLANTEPVGEDEMSYFPNHPRIRRAKKYDGDKDDKEETCTKHIKTSHRFTPGLFGVFCPHGIAIGFEAMRSFESPKIPFRIFYERFQRAPGTIIFDNACQASRYCLRREPLFFANTRFLIDRLHQHNHVICHSGYNMKFCPKDLPLLGGRLKLKDLNSQAAEQAHAKLELISTQTSFMRQDTFLQYTKLFLALTNQKVLKKLNAM